MTSAISDFRPLAALLVGLALGACSRPSARAGASSTSVAAPSAAGLDRGAMDHGPPPAASDAAASDFSVWDVGGRWRDQTGGATTLAAFRGTPTVVALMYTHCSSACPIAIATMKRIEGTAAGVRFVLVSLDPERDTPGALAAYARDKALSPGRWTLLNGSDGDIRALAAVLGVRYRRLSPDELAHSNALTLLDASGTIVHQQAGFDGTDETIDVARRLASAAEVSPAPALRATDDEPGARPATVHSHAAGEVVR